MCCLRAGLDNLFHMQRNGLDISYLCVISYLTSKFYNSPAVLVFSPDRNHTCLWIDDHASSQLPDLHIVEDRGHKRCQAAKSGSSDRASLIVWQGAKRSRRTVRRASVRPWLWPQPRPSTRPSAWFACYDALLLLLRVSQEISSHKRHFPCHSLPTRARCTPRHQARPTGSLRRTGTTCSSSWRA